MKLLVISISNLIGVGEITSDFNQQSEMTSYFEKRKGKISNARMLYLKVHAIVF